MDTYLVPLNLHMHRASETQTLTGEGMALIGLRLTHRLEWWQSQFGYVEAPFAQPLVDPFM